MSSSLPASAPSGAESSEVRTLPPTAARRRTSVPSPPGAVKGDAPLGQQRPPPRGPWSAGGGSLATTACGRRVAEPFEAGDAVTHGAAERAVTAAPFGGHGAASELSGSGALRRVPCSAATAAAAVATPPTSPRRAHATPGTVKRRSAAGRDSGPSGETRNEPTLLDVRVPLAAPAATRRPLAGAARDGPGPPVGAGGGGRGAGAGAGGGCTRGSRERRGDASCTRGRSSLDNSALETARDLSRPCSSGPTPPPHPAGDGTVAPRGGRPWRPQAARWRPAAPRRPPRGAQRRRSDPGESRRRAPVATPRTPPGAARVRSGHTHALPSGSGAPSGAALRGRVETGCKAHNDTHLEPPRRRARKRTVKTALRGRCRLEPRTWRQAGSRGVTTVRGARRAHGSGAGRLSPSMPGRARHAAPVRRWRRGR